MITKMRCTKCGNDKLQVITETNIQTTGKNYSSGKGCLGFLLFGPLGMLCGGCGEGQKTTATNKTFWICSECGNRFRDPADLREEIRRIKYTPLVCYIFGGLFALFGLPFLFGEMAALFWVFLLSGGLFGVLGFCQKRAYDKLQAELDQLERQMEHFNAQ